MPENRNHQVLYIEHRTTSAEDPRSPCRERCCAGRIDRSLPTYHVAATAVQRCGYGSWGTYVAPAARLLRIPVLGALEAVEYGTQGRIAGGFVLFYAAGLAGKFGHPGGEPGAAPYGQNTPAEDAVGPFEGGVFAPVLE